jgi:hypothetical protein
MVGLSSSAMTRPRPQRRRNSARQGTLTGYFSAGLYWKSNFHDSVRFGIGVGAYHLVQPKKEQLNQQRAEAMGNLYCRSTVDFNSWKLSLEKTESAASLLSFCLLNQGPACEELFSGLFLPHHFQTGFRKNNSDECRSRYRVGDAVIPTGHGGVQKYPSGLWL